jgi:hypothetical protein
MPPLALPRLSAEALRATTVTGTWLEMPGHPRRFLRYAPEFIDDPSGAGIFGRIGAAVYHSPPVFVSAARNAKLVGYRTIISDGGFRDDQIILGGESSEATFLNKIASEDSFLNEETGLRRAGAPDIFTLEVGDRRERHIPGTVVVLCSAEPSNYGSFLFRVVPKLQTLTQLGLNDLPMLVWTRVPSFQRLLQLQGVRPDQLIQHEVQSITTMDLALTPSLRNPNAYLDHESHALMQRLSDRFMGPRYGRRLYISRLRYGKTTGSKRTMLNEEQLAIRLADLNFEVIEPECLSPEDQIATFASADMIVGPSGSGMFNVVFCRPGTKVIDIESEPHWIYAHAGLFASCQLRYGLFVGSTDPTDTRPVHRRWTVDIEPLMDRVASFIHA